MHNRGYLLPDNRLIEFAIGENWTRHTPPNGYDLLVKIPGLVLSGMYELTNDEKIALAKASESISTILVSAVKRIQEREAKEAAKHKLNHAAAIEARKTAEESLRKAQDQAVKAKA